MCVADAARTDMHILGPLLHAQGPYPHPPINNHTGIPGLKICTAASPYAAYGLTKSMIRDNGPGILFLPVKLMKARFCEDARVVACVCLCAVV